MNEWFQVRKAEDSADTLIIETAIELSPSTNAVIIGEDVDLPVLLTALAPRERNIYFTKQGKGRAERKTYS